MIIAILTLYLSTILFGSNDVGQYEGDYNNLCFEIHNIIVVFSNIK